MQVSEEQKTYAGMGFKLTRYDAVMNRKEIRTDSTVFSEMHINPAQLHEAGMEFEKISTAIFREKEAKYGKFAKTGMAAGELLSDYGPNDLIIQYNHNNPLGLESAEIVEAETESGEQALGLIEHCMNEFKGIAGVIPLSIIPFGVSEAKSGSSRCATLVTEANHPPIRERCIIFVGEK